jgi:restriction endonuclease Mrr
MVASPYLIAAGGIIFIILILIAAQIGRRIKRRSAFLHWKRLTEQARSELVTFTLAVVQQHLHALCAQRRLKVNHDPYGRQIFDAWIHEVRYFVANILLPKLREVGIEQKFMAARNAYAVSAFAAGHSEPVINLHAGYVDQFLINIVLAELSRYPMNSFAETIDKIETGGEYEMLCASILESNGWQVRRVGASGDQGVDLIGMKGKKVVAFQCKFHDRAINNSAVQQILTGSKIHGAHIAVVISHSGYTKGARSAAHGVNVILLTTEELKSFNP